MGGMINLYVSPDLILLQFASDIAFVDHAVGLLNILLTYQGLPDPTNLLIVSRELLKNAVVHGNRNDPGKTVYYRLERVDEERYEVDVEDEGRGFSLQTVQAKADDRHGYELIHTLSAGLRFNEQGNRITACIGA